MVKPHDTINSNRRKETAVIQKVEILYEVDMDQKTYMACFESVRALSRLINLTLVILSDYRVKTLVV